MKGIIYKDYLHLLLPKNLLSVLFNVIVSLGVAIFFGGFAALATSVMILSVLGSSLLQITMEQDELSNFDRIQLTFPVTKKEIILSKYLSGFILQAGCFMLTLIIAIGYYFVGVVNFVLALQTWGFGVVIGTIFFAISYPGFFLLGNKRGTIMYAVASLITIVIYLLTFFNFDIRAVLMINHNTLLVIGLIIAVVCMIGSFIISLKIYTRKYL